MSMATTRRMSSPARAKDASVRVFSGFSNQQIVGPLGSFFAYRADFRGGVFVSAGDLNNDGRANMITGTGNGGGPHVRALNTAAGNALLEFFAYDAGCTRGGVRLAAADFNGDGRDDIVAAPRARYRSASAALQRLERGHSRQLLRIQHQLPGQHTLAADADA